MRRVWQPQAAEGVFHLRRSLQRRVQVVEQRLLNQLRRVLGGLLCFVSPLAPCALCQTRRELQRV